MKAKDLAIEKRLNGNGKSVLTNEKQFFYLRNCDFAQLGSPTMQTLMSPLKLMPS